MIAFGINSNDLEAAAPVIAAALGLAFKPHEGPFHGGDYYRAETVHGTVLLQSNCDADAVNEVPFEDDWPKDRLILYFDGRDDETWDPYVKRLLALAEFKSTKLSRTF